MLLLAGLICLLEMNKWLTNISIILVTGVNFRGWRASVWGLLKSWRLLLRSTCRMASLQPRCWTRPSPCWPWRKPCSSPTATPGVPETSYDSSPRPMMTLLPCSARTDRSVMRNEEPGMEAKVIQKTSYGFFRPHQRLSYSVVALLWCITGEKNSPLMNRMLNNMLLTLSYTKKSCSTMFAMKCDFSIYFFAVLLLYSLTEKITFLLRKLAFSLKSHGAMA